SENGLNLQKLSSGSPAIGAANTSYFSYVTTDMDGQARSGADIGADEYSTASVAITPLRTSNVGPASGGGIGGGDFSLSASPASVSVTQGSDGTSTIAVTDLNGFNGSVSLSASGLPSGVTASFNPSSTTGSSTLTLTASSTATTGTANVTITGTSGSLTHTTAVSLTVNATGS